MCENYNDHDFEGISSKLALCDQEELSDIIIGLILSIESAIKKIKIKVPPIEN